MEQTLTFKLLGMQTQPYNMEYAQNYSPGT